MYAFLTIVRYPKWTAWAGFLSMAYFRLPLFFNKNASFYKLLGCGKNGTFDKVPDLQQWAILIITNKNDQTDYHSSFNYKNIYGGFIANWWKFFGCSNWTLVLEPIEGHGTWDGKEVFGTLPRNSDYDGLIAVLTRATIRLNRLQQFWKHVEGVARHMSSSDGFITSLGIGEAPWIKQATFSIWKNKENLKAFAYKMHEHTEVIKKTKQEKWYSEDMFVRFKIIASHGSLNGVNLLEGKL
ncbi:MAG: spheroidene monooxygenase [Segetibacter sp.]